MKNHPPMKHQKLVAKQGKDLLIDGLHERIKDLEKQLEERKRESSMISPKLINTLLDESSELTIDCESSVLLKSIRLNLTRTFNNGSTSKVCRAVSLMRFNGNPHAIDTEINDMRESMRFLRR